MSIALLRKYIDILSETGDDMRPVTGNEPGGVQQSVNPAPTPAAGAAGPLKVPTKSPSTEWLDVQKVIQSLYPDSLPDYGADGYYGPETKAAIEKFQTDNNLNVDGLVGNQTIAALNKVLSDKKLPFKPSTPAEIAAPNQQPGDWKKSTTTPTTTTTANKDNIIVKTDPGPQQQKPTQPAKTVEPRPVDPKAVRKEVDDLLNKVLSEPVKETAAQQYRRLVNILQELGLPGQIPVGTTVTHSNGLQYTYNGTEWRSVSANPAANDLRAPSRIINDLNQLATSSPTPANTASTGTSTTSLDPAQTKTKSPKIMGWDPKLGRPPEAGETYKIPGDQPKKWGLFGGKEKLTWDPGLGRFTSTNPELDKLLKNSKYQSNIQAAFADKREGGRFIPKVQSAGNTAKAINKAANQSRELVGKGVGLGLRTLDIGYSIKSGWDTYNAAEKNYKAGNPWTGVAYTAATLAHAASAVAALHPSTKFTVGVGLAIGATTLEQLAQYFEEEANNPKTQGMNLAEKIQKKREYQSKIDQLEKHLVEIDMTPAEKEKFLAAINKLKQELVALQ